MQRNSIAVVLTVLLVVLAGCAGGGGSDGDAEEATTATPTPTADLGADGASGDGAGDRESDDGAAGDGDEPAGFDPGTPVSPGQYRLLAFADPVSLEYETYTATGVEGTLLVDVRDVGGDAATFDIDYRRDGVEQTSTISGDFDQVFSGLSTGEGEMLVYTLFVAHSGNHHTKQLAVGEAWNTRTGLPGDNRIAITGTETYAGVEWYVSELTVDDEPFATLCLRPGFGIPVHSVL